MSNVYSEQSISREEAIANLEATIENVYKPRVERRDALLKMQRTAGYKTIFEKHLLDTEIKRYNRFRVLPQASADQKENADNRLKALAEVELILDEIIVLGDQAEQHHIPEAIQQISDIRNGKFDEVEE